MTDLERILPLWRKLESAGADYVLTTVVGVEGPSYRKPGALMLITADGQRAGTVSGGCLEAEVASRAWWLTKNGPVVQRYSTAADDGDVPYGSGCGGTVILLLERSATARVLLSAQDKAFTARASLAVATIVEGPQTGVRAVAVAEPNSTNSSLTSLAELSFKRSKSIESIVDVDGVPTRVWCDFRPARTGLWVFGAGDDAQPLVRLAKELGWFVALADGRSHLATRDRFPQADETRVLAIKDIAGYSSHLLGAIRPHDVAVLMSHSYEQDFRVLLALLVGGVAVRYLGVLGPQRRSRELLAEAAVFAGIAPDRIPGQVEEWLARLHAPTGLDLGAESSESVALSVLAEVHKVLTSSTALALREVRAVQALPEASPTPSPTPASRL